jgi:predicted dehydrogenase
MKVAIIGCGLIGNKRAKALRGHELVSACDTNIERASALCTTRGNGKPTSDWKESVSSGADIVIVSTTNNLLTEISVAALKNNKHVLVEKPAARNVGELQLLVDAAKTSGRLVKVGFNHRFHPAISKAKNMVDSGEVGDLMFLRARYGHGGRLGYEKEWRADKSISGGGELIDQGSHLIDLSRWFLGDFTEVKGSVHTYFWKMACEDNAFLSLTNKNGNVAWLHASCSEWKNIFCLEIYGKTGKLQIDGLGGSYGTERLTFYKMLPQMGPPETKTWEFPGDDVSWELEFNSFAESILKHTPLCGDVRDSYEALKIIEQVYQNKQLNE